MLLDWVRFLCVKELYYFFISGYMEFDYLTVFLGNFKAHFFIIFLCIIL
jgi:hypothetical protein